MDIKITSPSVSDSVHWHRVTVTIVTHTVRSSRRPISKSPGKRHFFYNLSHFCDGARYHWSNTRYSVRKQKSSVQLDAAVGRKQNVSNS